jgi:folate-binding protein YgfZ
MTPGASALRSAAALVAPLPRAVYRLTGEKPLAYLHDILAQEVASLGAGRGALAVALSPNGRISAEVRVLPLFNGSVLLDAEPEARAGIEERVGRHAGLAGCELEALDVPVAALRGPDAEAVLGAAGIPLPHQGEAMFVEREGFLVVRVAWGVPGFDLIGKAPDVAAEPATLEDLEAARIEAGRPRFGVDLNEDVLVNETPLLEHAVAGNKGCYPGQESVAKIRTIGNVRRKLRGLRATEAGLRAGAEVRTNGDVVGTITSATDLPVAGSAAIALLRSEVAPGATVEAGATAATVTSLT